MLGLFLGSIVETGGSLLLEGNVCVALRGKRLEIHGLISPGWSFLISFATELLDEV